MHSKKLESKQNPKLLDHQLHFEAIGTAWQIDLYNLDVFLVPEIEKLILDRIQLFDQTYSRFKEDSVIKKISVVPGKYPLDKDGKKMLDLYWQLYQATNSAFTPLIGNVLADAGYDDKYSLNPKKLDKPYSWEEALELNETLNVKKPVLLDFGAIGKGYLVDIIGKLIEDKCIKNYCIDAGGDILYKNEAMKPIQVGLENPENAKQIIGIASIINQSICGSAGNRRKWGEFHHIINPHTLTSPENILAVWVVAPTAAVADALSTCLFLVKPDKLKKEYHFEYLIMFADHTIDKSHGFPAEVYN